MLSLINKRAERYAGKGFSKNYNLAKIVDRYWYYRDHSYRLIFKTMITQYQVNSFLREKLPQLSGQHYPSKVSLDIYVSMNNFTDYTKHALEEHNFNQVKKCFALAENLYLNGDNMVRRLIKNSFMHSFSSFMAQGGAEQYVVKSILPDTLYKIYKEQLIK